MIFGFSPLISLVAFAGSSLAATYSLSDNVVGSGFNSFFNYQAISDPTHGRVNYVSQSTAQSQNLTYASSNTFILRSDYKTTLSASGAGRNSVRLSSKSTYTTAVMVFNVRHMPQGCGTWPAIWTVGGNWPYGGEIDILEGVNDQDYNAATLHTSAGCTMPASRAQTGTALGNNCDVAVTNNAGCGVQFPYKSSYGITFNNNGGGWYAMERTNSGIKVWFWNRVGTGVPSDVSSPGSTVNTGNWGTPYAYFPNTSCNIASRFSAHNLIINLTFCGDWAGQSSVYNGAGCPGTCVDYVNSNPSAFSKAYFDFAWIRIYE